MQIRTTGGFQIASLMFAPHDANAGDGVTGALTRVDAFVPADEVAADAVAREMAAATAPVSGGVLHARQRLSLSFDDLKQFGDILNRGSFDEATAEIDRLVDAFDHDHKPSELFFIATTISHHSVFSKRYELFPLKVLHHIAQKAVSLKDLASFDPEKGGDYVNGYRNMLNWLYHFELHCAQSGTGYAGEMQALAADIHFAAARTMALQSLIEDPDNARFAGEFSQILDAKLRYKKLGAFKKVREVDDFTLIVEDHFRIRNEEVIAGYLGDAEAEIERIAEESGYGRDLIYDRVEKNIATVEKFRDHLVAVAGVTQSAMTEFEHQKLTQHANFFRFLEDIAHEIEALYAGTEDAKKIISLVSDIMHVKARYGQLYYAGSRDKWTEDQMRYEMPVVVLQLSEVIKRYRFVGEDDNAGDVEAFLERMKKRFDLPDGDLREWALDREKEYFEGSMRFLQGEEAAGGFLEAMLSAFLTSYTSAACSFGYKTEAEFLRWMAARLHELGHDEFVHEQDLLGSAAKAERIGRSLGLI